MRKERGERSQRIVYMIYYAEWSFTKLITCCVNCTSSCDDNYMTQIIWGVFYFKLVRLGRSV